MNKISKLQLANALFATTTTGGMITISGTDFTGIISIERESGSGHTFNVTGYNIYGERVTVYCETID